MPGYNVKTVEPLKAALVCPECNLLLKDAVQTGDGIRLCKTCFEQFEEYPNRTSPKSKMTIGKEHYSDKAVQREILQLPVLCSGCRYGCTWQGQLQDLEGHCQDCVHKLVACSNPKLIPADSDIHEPFEMVAGNHCGEETTVNRLEVPVDRGRCPESIALKEYQQREYPYDDEYPTPGCGEILLKATEKELINTASQFMNPLVLFQHVIAVCTYIGNGFQKMGQIQWKANSEEAEGSETVSQASYPHSSPDLVLDEVERCEPMVSQASYTHNDTPASVDPMAKVNSNKAEDSRAIIPRVTPFLEDFTSAFISAVDPSYFKDKISSTLADALNPLVSHLCRQSWSRVEFGRMKYEPVDDPSKCPEAFIPKNLFRHMKKEHHISKYADFFGYKEDNQFRCDVETLLQHIHDHKKKGSVPSRWLQLHNMLDNTINFLTGIEASLQQKNESRLACDLSIKIDELEKTRSEIELLCGQTLTSKP